MNNKKGYDYKINILKPKIIKENKTIIYKFKLNSNIYQFYNKYYCKNINLYNGIEGVICILIPFCILNNVFIESDIEIDEKFYNNLDNILNYYRNIHNDNDLNFNYKFKIKYSDANLNNNNNKVILPFTLGK